MIDPAIDGEVLPELLLYYASLKRAGLSRRERLIRPWNWFKRGGQS